MNFEISSSISNQKLPNQCILDNQRVLSSKELNELISIGQVFVRSIRSPMSKNLNSKYLETNWEIELRKSSRKLGQPTRTKKSDSCEKNGNPNRSTTLFHHNISLFSPIGYGIISPKIEDIKIICSNMDNFVSGIGKKKLAHESKCYDNLIDQRLSKSEQLELLLTHIKNNMSNAYSINEVLMNIRTRNLNFIYYLYDINQNDALYMQKTAEQQLGKYIPVYQYSKTEKKFIFRN